MFRLVRTFFRYAEVFGLLVGHNSEFHADMIKVQAGYLFIEVFWQPVHIDVVSYSSQSWHGL